MAIEIRDDTVVTTAMPVGSWLVGGRTSADAAPTAWGREAIFNYVASELAPVASSGSASDLTTGTVPSGRLHSHLADISAIPAPATSDVIYYNGTAWVAGPLTTSGVGVLVATENLADVDDAETARSNLGLTIGTHVQAHNAGLGQIAALSDPNADRILFWDDSAGAYTHLATGNGLAISTTTISVDTSTLTFGNADLKIYDTNASHTAAFAVGSDLTANRTITITTGDANRTFDLATLSGTGSTGQVLIKSAATEGSIAYRRRWFYLGDYATFSDALTAASGNTLVIEPGTSITSVSGFTIPAGTQVIGYGATLTMTAQTTALDMSASGCELRGLTITGPGQGASIGSGIGVYISGTINGAGVAPTYTSKQKLIDVTINGFDAYAGYLQAASDVEIQSTRISNVRYGGFMCISVLRVKCHGAGDILGPFSGSASNAYGITFTRNSGSTDYVRYPASEDCVVDGWTIREIPLWAAYDTHGGTNIRFTNCTAINCRLAFNLSSDAQQKGPEDCWVVGCTVEIETSSSAHNKIYAGVIAGVSATYPARNCGIIGGTWRNCGIDATTAGAIYLVYTVGARVADMVLDTPLGAGIQVDVSNIGAAVADITVINPTGTTTVEPPCVRVEDGGAGASSTVRIDNLTGITTSATTGFTYKSAYLVSVNGSYNVVRMGVFQRVGTWTGTSAGTITATALESASPTITSPTISGYKSVTPGDAVLYTPETIATTAGLVLFGYRADGIDRVVDANEANYFIGVDVQQTQADIGSGFTDSGYRMGMRFSANINDANFQGTLSALYGVNSVVGILAVGASGARTVSNVYGYYLDMRDTAGTISNKWGFYQVNTAFTNYFDGVVRSNTSFNVSTNKVVGARDTGWTAFTGTTNKATGYATGTVTLVQLAERVAAMQVALTTHGLLGV